MPKKIQAEEIRKVLRLNDVTGGARKTKTLACNLTGLSPHSVCRIFKMLEAHNENGIAGIYSASGCSDRLRDAFAEALGYDAKQRAEAKIQREKTLDAIQVSTVEQKPDDNAEEKIATEKTAAAAAATPAVIEELLASIVQSLDVIAEELVHLRYAV